MYRIEVTKEYLGFAAAHFITMKGKCERLHGHNYQTWFEVEGELTDDGYVFDFTELKQIAKALCATLDHRVLLATENPKISIHADNDSVYATYENQRYMFPADDVALLPIRNTTAELLATYLARQLAQHLRGQSSHNARAIGVWVAEGPGQRAYCRQEL
ncbi:MAG: 6-carboxytetrahydropterin synthase [Chloroflexota bacterium]|nr:6-carboxytetrahydropterin synthase [Chloroflexota bacterium]PLS82213.1 MAG: 6-pyruvoyl tetrahydrobiopterin synthase [Chloroflexota bacterium]